jgi:hypothetical protein
LFSDEENGYALDETKYKLKLDAPTASDGGMDTAPSVGDQPAPEPSFGDDNQDTPDEVGGDNDNPFEKKPFDAGVEADEESDPKKFIQQLAGKIGQSLRDYEKGLDNPDFELEKFVINSVISATNTADMDDSDRKDIIDKIETSGADDNNQESDSEIKDDNNVDDNQPDSDGMGDEQVDEMSLGDDIEEIFLEWSKPMELTVPVSVSGGLKYHLDNKLPLGESVFRYGSDKYIQLLKEVKALRGSNLISLNENDEFIVNSAIPKLTYLNGKEILLNAIYEEESNDDLVSEDEMVEHLPTFTQIAALGAPMLALIIRNILKGDEKSAKQILNKELKDKPNDNVNESDVLNGIKQIIAEAEYKGKNVELNKPKRGGSKKFYVYVKDPSSGNIKKVSFGAKAGGGNLAVKLKDPKARKAFSDRHNCPEKTDKTTAGYWACSLPRFAKSLGLSGGGRYW